jgi:hypothetical protein
MTGTGTNIDPFVVSNWSELKSSAEQNDVYIRLSYNDEWNMNDEYPEGIPLITLRCAEIDGNNSVIKNLRASGGVFTYGGKNTVIKNLTFESMYLSNCVFLYWQSPNTEYTLCSFENVKIGGELYGAALASVYHLPVIFNRCSISLYLSNGEFNNDSDATFSNCDIRLIGTTSAVSNIVLKSSRLQGNIESVGELGYFMIRNASEYSVVDISMINYSEVTAIGDINGVLINIDKTGNAEVNNKFIQATSAQMKDAEWLHDHGFPCGRG